MTGVSSSGRSADASALALLDRVDVTALSAWLAAIPWTAWPKQFDGRPAMINDPLWHDLALVTSGIRHGLMTEHFPGHRDFNIMLSAVMPGACIVAHVDRQQPEWHTRIHVPVVSNDHASFVIDGQDHRLAVGYAYSIDITRMHAVLNSGDTPRVHLMWDVVA